MARDQIADRPQVFRFDQRLEIDRFEVAALLGEVSPLVEYVSNSATHAGGKISTARTEHDDQTIRHVLAPMIADTLDHGGGSGIANGKAFACHAIEEGLAT